ncbi:MAG: hypothetical protein IV094_23650 [Vitreoscilla sp.]|nr:hypothetical protein [Vitreoscilla sp.]
MRTPLLHLLLLASTSVLAQEPSALQACRGVTDAAKRLACYDALPAPAAPASAAAANFGLEVKAMQAAPGEVTSRIEGRFDGWGPKSLIRLANGQLWQIADDSDAVLNLSNPQVTIRRGALGGFRMELDGTNRTARVKRLQ